ncbi:MAG: PAS domain S-box protein [Prolixibacteraceae bacterium]
MENEQWGSEEFFQNIFEFHTAAQLIIEPESGRIVDANRAAENFYGWSKEQLRKMQIGDINTLTPEELKQAMLNAKKRKQNHFEFKHRLADTTIRDVEVFSCDIRIKGEKLLHSIIHDITKRKQAEEDIKQSEARLQRAELASKSGNWELHLDTRLMHASEGAMKLYGVNHSINQFDKIKNVPLPEYRNMLNVAFNSMINSGQAYNVEFKLERLSDKKILDIHSLAYYDKEKKIIFGTIQDITDRKLAEEAMKESEEKFRILFTQMAEGFALHKVIYDETQTAVDYRIVDVNPAFEKLVGISNDKAIGALASELYGISPAPFLEIYAQVAETGKYHSFENYVASMDRYFDISVFSPKQGFFATIFSDTTESKRAEEKLIEEQEFNKMLIENLPGIFYIYSYPDLQIVSWNKNHETMLGLKPEELKNRFVDEWPHAEVKENLISAMHTVYNEGYIQMEASFYGKDGSEIPLILTAVRLETKDQTYIMGYGIDFSDRKLADEALRKSEAQLRELNATKDKFFSIIAHDLKSPFNSILGLSNLLVEQIQANHFEGIEEYAAIIQNSSKRAMDLLLNLLEWSRSQTGRMEFNPEYIELVSLINEVAELLNESAQQKGISISIESPKKIIAYADKAMISTVMRNLLSNAIKFTHTGGTIKIILEKNRSELLISVIDDGIGISQENIKKLFSLENNISTLGTNKEKGTGLGLVLCKEFVDKHNGSIGVESNNDKSLSKTGSKFYFTIPLA